MQVLRGLLDYHVLAYGTCIQHIGSHVSQEPDTRPRKKELLQRCACNATNSLSLLLQIHVHASHGHRRVKPVRTNTATRGMDAVFSLQASLDTVVPALRMERSRASGSTSKVHDS